MNGRLEERVPFSIIAKQPDYWLIIVATLYSRHSRHEVKHLTNVYLYECWCHALLFLGARTEHTDTCDTNESYRNHILLLAPSNKIMRTFNIQTIVLHFKQLRLVSTMIVLAAVSMRWIVGVCTLSLANKIVFHIHVQKMPIVFNIWNSLVVL